MQLERKSLLIADDDAEIRHLIRQQLESAGFQTRLARTGHEALNAVYGHRFAGVILDIAMPEMDGFGVLEGVRGLTNPPPVLMLTARYGADDVSRALALGARDYLAKPFSEQQLISRVERLLRPRRAPPPTGELLI